MCLLGAIVSIIYCLDIGLYLFDNVDHFINSYVMLILGILECCGVGWFYKFNSTVKKIGKKSAMIAGIGYWTSLFIGIFITFHVFEY